MATQQQINDARHIFIAMATANVIWDYADEVVNYCAANKLNDTRKMSQQVRALKREYDAIISSRLDVRQKFIADWAGKDFRESFSYDLLVLYCTVGNELSRKYAGVDIDHFEMRAKALCAIVIRRALHAMPDSIHLPKLYELDKLLTSYVAPYELDVTANVATTQKILTKRLASLPERECDLDIII